MKLEKRIMNVQLGAKQALNVFFWKDLPISFFY